MSSTGCPICAKHRSDDDLRVFANEHVVVSQLAPPAPDGEAHLGYLFVEPRRHVEGLAQLHADEAAAFGRAAARAARALERVLEAEHVYAAVIGHDVAHLHLHVIARHPGTPEAYWFARVDEWPDGPRGGHDELARLAGRLGAAMHAERR